MAEERLFGKVIGISIFIFFICFIFTPALKAEVIVLKTGVVIKGVIIQDVSQDVYGLNIKIQSEDGQLLTIRVNDIETIEGKVPQRSPWLVWYEKAGEYQHSVLVIIDECKKIAMEAKQICYLSEKVPVNASQKSKKQFHKLIDDLKALRVPEHLESYHAKALGLCEYLAVIVDENFVQDPNAKWAYWRKAFQLELESLEEMKRVFVEKKTPQPYIDKIDVGIKDLEHMSGALNVEARDIFIKGITFAASGDFGGAKKEFKKSLELGSPADFVQPYLDILQDIDRGVITREYGYAFFRAENAVVTVRPMEAIKEYEELLRMRDDNAYHIAEKLGRLYLFINKLDDAEVLFNKYKLQDYQKIIQEYKKYLRRGSQIESNSESLSLVAQIGYGEPIKTVEDPEYLFYIPSGLTRNTKFPLVIAFSPNGDAVSMLNVWKGIAERKKLFVLASKTYRNGVDLIPIFDKLESSLKKIFIDYPLDTDLIIVTGMSGGGMGAHLFSFYYPHWVSAIIVNTGMIHPQYKVTKTSYPKNKIAVFLASPTDFRYREMQSDKNFLEDLGWKTKWIEFSGGHIIAPEKIYNEAIDWLEGVLGLPKLETASKERGPKR